MRGIRGVRGYQGIRGMRGAIYKKIASALGTIKRIQHPKNHSLLKTTAKEHFGRFIPIY